MIQNVYSDIINNSIEKIMGIKIPAKFVVADDEESIKKAEEDCEGLTFENFFTFDTLL